VEAVVVAVADVDRVGLGWRGEIAAHILGHLEQIDVLEVIADNYFNASKSALQSLQFLARQKPVFLHGVGMGLASCSPVNLRYLDAMARLVHRVEPAGWSEHLAFVRAGGIEIGHLAAPPRNQQTVEGTINNIQAARRVVGTTPELENIATLVQPPASSLSEPEWLELIVTESASPLLLDLHNLYANAVNTGRDPHEMLMQLPLAQVGCIHLSGGHWISTPDKRRQRLLDDHIHDVPDEVFELLSLVARYARQPLTVLIERDGNFPEFTALLAQLDRARTAVRLGRRMANGGDL
jgi:uncharacterized protein